MSVNIRDLTANMSNVISSWNSGVSASLSDSSPFCIIVDTETSSHILESLKLLLTTKLANLRIFLF